MILGIVRLISAEASPCNTHSFAIVSCAILVVWHFPPNERFVLPLAPLLLAGLITELEHLASMIRLALRHKDVGQRVVAAGMGLVVAAVVIGAVVLQFIMAFGYLHDSAQMQREKLADQCAPPSKWIDANVPPGIKPRSSRTTIRFLYLYTGHSRQLGSDDSQSLVRRRSCQSRRHLSRHRDVLPKPRLRVFLFDHRRYSPLDRRP